MRNRLELKFKSDGVTDEGSFSGVASPYGNIDLGNEVVERGAFTKSLSESTEVPILWQHQRETVIGVGVLVDTPKGLEIKGDLVLEVEKAREAHALLKRKALKGLSIGYEVVKGPIENGVRRLKELKLWEVSLVTFPMNPLAQVTSFKGFDFGTEQEVESTFLKRFEHAYNLQMALDGILYDESLSSDQKAANASDLIERFAHAHTEFTPRLLELMATRKEAGLGRLEQKTSTDEAITSLRALLPKAEAAQPSDEPVIDHSMLSDFTKEFKELFL